MIYRDFDKNLKKSVKLGDEMNKLIVIYCEGVLENLVV